MFKDLTEAYSVIGDSEKRARYDQLIFGDSARGEFSNQQAYEYWGSKERSSADKNKVKTEHEKHQERVKDIMKQNFEWDPVNAFWNLRDITYPKVKAINIE